MAHSEQAPVLPAGLVQPQSIITLKTPMYGDVKAIWVTEDRQTVTRWVNDATTRLVQFTQVKGMKPHPVSVRPANVANVETCS